MKILSTLFLLMIWNNVSAQLYNLIYMKIENGQVTRNIEADTHAYSFMKSYSGKNYAEAIAYLDSIALAGERDYKLLYNKVICYNFMNEEDSVKKYLLEYLQFEDNGYKVPGIIKYSNLYKFIESDEKLKALYDQLENEFCDSITNCQLALQIQFCVAKEQEIMMDTAFTGRKNRDLKFQLMKENSDPIINQLKKGSFPKKEEIGAAYESLGLLILHMDYDPKGQLKWSKKIYKQAKQEGGDFGFAVYAIDRSLKNLGKKQKYGSINFNRGTEKSEIYRYRGSFKSLNKRRKKIGLDAIKKSESSIIIN